MNILDAIGQTTIDKVQAERPVPHFEPGDTLKVHVKVQEGTRERLQVYEGVCIARKNAGVNSSFTVRKISFGEGVERVFPLYSPSIWEIEVVRKGIVRRAKLYYLRDLRGKASRIVEDTEAQRELLADAGRGGSQASAPREAQEGKAQGREGRPRRQGRRKEVAVHHGVPQEVGYPAGAAAASADPVREDLGQPRRPSPGRRHLRHLHRPSPRSRGDQPAGLRGPAHGRPAGAPARRHHRRRRPQHADDATAARASRTRSRASRSRRSRRTSPTSACPTST